MADACQVVLGNTAPIEGRHVETLDAAKALVKDPKQLAQVAVDLERDKVAIVRKPIGGPTHTTFSCPAGSLQEQFSTVTQVFAGYHSDQPAAWVESSSDSLAVLLADHFGCPTGRPKGWPS